MTARRISIKDLAQELNLSSSTVSRALAGLPTISSATQQRVRELAYQRNFRVNALAAGLRKGSTGVLGVLVPRLTGHFFPEVLHSISAAATRAKQRVIICESDENEQQEQQQLHWLLTAQVDGLLVCATNPAGSTSHFQMARQRGVPLVFFHQVGLSADVHAVVLDQYQAAYTGVHHLLAQGRMRIAHFAGPEHEAVSRHHQNGYARALCEHNLALDEHLVHWGEVTVEAGRQHMLAVLASAVVPDAIFVSHDVVAIGALQVLHEQKVRVPETIALVGCSTESMAALASPPLTSLDPCSRELGKAAVQLLLARLADPNVVCQCVSITPQLQVRASSVSIGKNREASVSPISPKQEWTTPHPARVI